MTGEENLLSDSHDGANAPAAPPHAVGPLAKLDVLALDCQATGPNPETHHLLEIGWAPIRASRSQESNESRIESHLVRLPAEVEIPRRVTRLTGLKNEDLEPGLPMETLWAKLVAAARQIAANSGLDLCPTIIHYSRFEEAFLHSLHRQYGGEETFPFDIICTHQVMRRLFPGLPRKGLRAAAGYLGHSVPEFRRSTHHTAATVFIWQQAVQLLKEKNIRTLEELKEWLKKPPEKAPGSGREFPMAAALRLNLPQKPGIYRMFRSNGDLLYIGKATSLKHRVNSYFHKKKHRSYSRNTLEMLTQAAHLEVMVTGSALEAALLENDEIKKHAPPYNVALRPGSREIVFFSRDFREFALTPDNAHPVGPLPSPVSLAAFSALDALLKGELNGMTDMEISTSVLGTLPEYAPEPGCFQAGVELFRQRHGDFLKTGEENSSIRGLLKLGKQLWLRKMEELARAEAEAEEKTEETGETEEVDEEPPETGKEWVWTPESAAGVMEGVIRHGARLVRRSRWYCLLSESSLSWLTGKNAGRQRRLLVFQGGAITRQEDIGNGKEIPVPPGYKLPFSVRQGNFDIVTYDRLRVLTTELRRLVTDESDRQVCLRLSPGVELGSRELFKLFQWI